MSRSPKSHFNFSDRLSSRRVLTKKVSLVFVLFSLVLIQTPLTSFAAGNRCEKLFPDHLVLRQIVNASVPNISDFVFDRSSSLEANLKNFSSAYGIQFNPEFRSSFSSIDFRNMEQKEIKNGFSGSYATPIEDGFLEYSTFEPRVEITNPNPVRTKPVFTDSITRSQELLGEIWSSSKGPQFRFMNASVSDLSKDGSAEQVFAAAKNAVIENPDLRSEIQVPFNPRWAKARQVILDRQRVASQKATDNYLELKPYLPEEVLYSLRAGDRDALSRSDYFMLLKDGGRSPLSIDAHEFYQDLVVMARIARLDYHSVWDSRLVDGEFSYGAQLPHQARVPAKYKQMLKNFFDQLAEEGRLNIGELSRFNRMAEVPREVMDAFMLKILKTIRNPSKPIDLLILECDEGLVPYYERYNFKIFVKLLDEPGSKPEYLMHLDTRSEAYQQIIEKLENGAKLVVQKTDLQPPPVSQWTSGWKDRANYYSHSPVEKIKLGWALLEKMRTEARVSKINKPLLNGVDLFDKASDNLVKYVAVSIGARENILIPSIKDNELVRFLKKLYPLAEFTMNWAADLVKENSQHRIILIQKLAGLSGSDQLKILRSSFQALKSGQSITVIEHFNDDQYDRPTQKKITAQHVSVKDFIANATEIGFITNPHTGFTIQNDLKGITFKKP